VIESGKLLGSADTIALVRAKVINLIGDARLARYFEFTPTALKRLLAVLDEAEETFFGPTTVKVPFDDIPTMRGILGILYSDNARDSSPAGEALETWLLCTDESLKEVQHRSIVEHLSRITV